MYLDSKGLIVTKTGDGGDTLQREGFWYEGMYLNPSYVAPSGMATYVSTISILRLAEVQCPPLPVPARYWEAPYNNPGDTSRDQLVSNIRALGYLNPSYSYLSQIFQSVVKNFSRFPNGDICFVNDYARFIRAFKLWYLYPLLFIFDLPIFVNALLICFWLTRLPGPLRIWLASKASWLFWLTNQYPPNAEGVPQSPYGPTNTSNDVNFIGDLAQAQNVYPTPISFIARKIYRCFRPCGVQFALDSYFNLDTGNNAEFALLWKPIVDKF